MAEIEGEPLFYPRGVVKDLNLGTEFEFGIFRELIAVAVLFQAAAPHLRQLKQRVEFCFHDMERFVVKLDTDDIAHDAVVLDADVDDEERSEERRVGKE